MRDKEFEWFLKGVFEQLGYQVEVTKASGDQGVDLIVSGGGRRIAIQVKGYANAVGNSAVQEVYAGMNYWKCKECAVITNSRFTKSARHLAASLNCKLIDRRSMDDLMAGEHTWARSLRTADDYSRIKHPIEPGASARNQMQASGGTGSSRPPQVPTVPHPSGTSPEQNPDSEFDQMPNWGQAGTFLLVVFVLALVGLGSATHHLFNNGHTTSHSREDADRTNPGSPRFHPASMSPSHCCNRVPHRGTR